MPGFETTTVELAAVSLQTYQAGLIGFLIGPFVILLGIFSIIAALKSFVRWFTVSDAPTEPIQAAAAGRTKVKGTARPLGDPVRRPFSEDGCIAARFIIGREVGNEDDTPVRTGYDPVEMKREKDTDGWFENQELSYSNRFGDRVEVEMMRSGNAGWEGWSRVDRDTLVEPFQIDDGTGTIRVDADKKTLVNYDTECTRKIEVGPHEREPPEVIGFIEQHTDMDIPSREEIDGPLFGEQMRYMEQWIPVGEEVLALGGAEPVRSDETTTSGLALRRDMASDEFIVSAQSNSENISKSGSHPLVYFVLGFVLIILGLVLILNPVF